MWTDSEFTQSSGVSQMGGPNSPSEEWKEKLVQAVQSRKLLWDHTLDDKRNKGLATLAWKEISNELGDPDQDLLCKMEWKKLRDAFSRKKRALKGKTGQARKKIEDALSTGLFLLMKFLDDVPTIANTSGNLEGDESCSDEDENNTSRDAANAKTSIIPNEEDKQATPTYSSLRHRKRPMDEVDKELVEFLKKPKEAEDEYHFFGMSVAADLRKMDPGLALFTKMRVQQTIYECKFPPQPAPTNFSEDSSRNNY